MATISEGAGLVTLINTFKAKPGQQTAIVRSLKRVTEDVMMHLPGFVSANVHEGLDGVTVINYAQWANRADFEAMFKHPQAQAHMAELKSLADSISPILFAVASTSPPA